ncbi:ACR231Cp [Eremothecium gossypii ATCC 10895]|uniref:ACR231Cp n=1 Tax=Eremothecium gossypii (strain ATCC 10895 / CBS 109.51 / FGSC 9923 / NRRL Y-1056) TaxID=284811 RepID=Q75BP0_EREGS|nr:ACR231Cp [Eremothecium gossypii ATCC 10895]AAS51457.1 ACR231Cp [Eremothecium gossypii ATCC 10895]AEY95748.1 FACR231Cp [Eremothecium gossypii FDAG1]
MGITSITIGGVPLSPGLSPVLAPVDGHGGLGAPALLQLDERRGSQRYETSLSKLAELTPGGGSASAGSPVSSLRLPAQSLFRVGSPMRTSMMSQVPKMLRPEYMNVKAGWRDQLFKTRNSIPKDGAVTVASALTSSAVPTMPRELAHEAPLEGTSAWEQAGDGAQVAEASGKTGQARPSAFNSYNKGSAAKHSSTHTPKVGNGSKSKHARELSVISCLSGKTLFEPDSLQPPTGSISQPPSGSVYQFPSASPVSSSSSANLAYAVDENGFVMSNNKHRDSVLSATMEDRFWMDYQDEINQGHRMSSDGLQFEPLKGPSLSLQTERFELKVKRLEVQIEELQLQNDKLKHSMEHSAIQDKLLLDALHEAREGRNNYNQDAERSLKALERKIQGYKRTIYALTTYDGYGPLRHKVALLNDEQLEAIANDDVAAASVCGQPEGAEHAPADKKESNPVDEQPSRGRSYRARNRGLHLNLSIVE